MADQSSVVAACANISQAFQPVVDWAWAPLSTSADYPASNQVMASPVVGDIDGDGIPEVAFVSWSNQARTDGLIAYGANGVLRVVDGRTGQPKFSVGNGTLAPFASTSPLLVDLDNDGRMEIVYLNWTKNAIVALNANGGSRWTWSVPNGQTFDFCAQGLSAADLNQNGRAEVLAGGWALEEQNGSPVVTTTLSPFPGSLSCATFASVLDPRSPAFSVVGPYGVYDANGVRKYTVNGGYLGVGKIRNDVDGLQVIRSGGGTITIMNGLTGAVLTNIDLSRFSGTLCPGTGSTESRIGGGPVSVGDFKGDGTLQIALATGQNLLILDGQGNLLASARTQDCSSLSTGITAFDFNGDGVPEIVYSDEEYLRVYHLNNGQLNVIAKFVNPTGTLNEYPVVADIKGDGKSSLLVVSNNFAASSFYQDPGEAADGVVAANITGIRAFRSGDGLGWMPSRPSWSQYHFNAALVNDRGRVNTPAAASAPYLSRTFKMSGALTSDRPRCQ